MSKLGEPLAKTVERLHTMGLAKSASLSNTCKVELCVRDFQTDCLCERFEYDLSTILHVQVSLNLNENPKPQPSTNKSR